ncbi:MAG TPA: glycoside hydrolase family 25 protein [Candidatus Elarobacter sp.]
MVNGIDISAYQPNVNFSQVHGAGYSFVYVKATESTGYTSSEFGSQWHGAAAAGMLRGGYHFFDFNASPLAQAAHFLATCPPAKGALPPMLDLETTDGVPPAPQNVADVAAFLHVVEKATGVRCVLYINYGCWSGTLGGTAGFSGHPFWAPSYLNGVNGPPPTQSTPPIMQPPPPQITAWSTWTFWQYSQTGQVPGIAGAVDLDVFNGSLAQLQALAQK